MLRSPAGDMKIEVQLEPHYRPPVWPSADGDQLMMIHLDFGVADVEAGVSSAVAQGATLADHQPRDDALVMLDPEGHPFCLFPDDSLEGAILAHPPSDGSAALALQRQGFCGARSGRLA
jgi:hypothetical protein